MIPLKMALLHNEYYASIEKDKILQLTAIWIKLDGNILNEMKGVYTECLLSYMTFQARQRQQNWRVGAQTWI